MKPFIAPRVVITHKVNISLKEIGERLLGKPNMVRVGLPDSKTTQEGNQIRRERRVGKKKQ